MESRIYPQSNAMVECSTWVRGAIISTPTEAPQTKYISPAQYWSHVPGIFRYDWKSCWMGRKASINETKRIYPTTLAQAVEWDAKRQ